MPNLHDDRYCFLAGKTCDIEPDIRALSCFISIPFKLDKELGIIKRFLGRLKIRALVADTTSPQFLFHNVCANLSKAMVGIFEVTETNEGVFAEYGMMVEQGKPAILLYSKQKRRKELHSDMKGILQTRYQDRRSMPQRLYRTFLTLPKQMLPPEGSILELYLLSYEFNKELKAKLRKGGFNINFSNYDIAYLRKTGNSVIFSLKITSSLSKKNLRFEVTSQVDFRCLKKRVLVSSLKIHDANIKNAETVTGGILTQEIAKTVLEIQEIIVDTLTEVERKFLM